MAIFTHIWTSSGDGCYLESLYAIFLSFSQLRVRNIEVVQSGVNRLETRGYSQTFVAGDPIFILSGEKLD